ncbi:(NiFe)-hydrogenase-3-type complex Eha, EhaM [Methanococcus vannielii SB]|jgi:energy-converting hydrogenase A subunit M|uniref:(NiFe)-hydrogenase-3-type complex Eha, EhaM n=1 Tax=Methanococcus vannielii (strain ATCC 35089 / DSM 1224 / JCM 13029 / OCM 148 / SB) TaxID=406327 RepID=A6UQA5_METVS|nr:DUF1959 domain-containing protein [Methanococcus vannielii]ABR54677.1 (NiFe)-hydrogenase-3-type complex Eha, EhaM [Methanococcus vannielii SB]
MLEDIDKNYKDSSLKQKYNIIKGNRYIMEEAIVPISKALKLPMDDVVDIFVKIYDSASLYESHAYVEQAKMGCLGRRVDIDLGLCWIADFFGLISKNDADLIRKKVVEDTIIRKKPYNESLEEGRALAVKILKGEE